MATSDVSPFVTVALVTLAFGYRRATPRHLVALYRAVRQSGGCLVVGTEQTRRVDVRVIAATNADLETRVARGGFRGEFDDRLRVAPWEIPPLRQRPGDEELLPRHFIRATAKTHGVAPVRFSSADPRLPLAHPWPGNVRELRNVCERMAILHQGTEIQPEHLPREFHAEAPLTAEMVACFAQSAGGGSGGPGAPPDPRGIGKDLRQPHPRRPATAPEPGRPALSREEARPASLKAIPLVYNRQFPTSNPSFLPEGSARNVPAVRSVSPSMRASTRWAVSGCRP